MESKVIFRDGMDNDPQDYNNLQDFVQQSIDDIVNDAVDPGRKYAGFVAEVSAAAEVTVSGGRLYSGGKVYVRADDYVKNFTTSLPVATKKNVLVVVFGQESDVDNRAREFLINEDSGASEPRVVSNEHARICNINVVSGVEAPDPLDPIVDAGVMPIARITLSPSGVTQVVMLTDNAIRSSAEIAEAVDELSDATKADRTKIVALDSQVAAITSKIKGNVGQDAFGRALLRLADLEAKDGIPSTAADSFANYFLDTTGSDLANGSSDCVVMEGIRFADTEAASAALALLNPINAAAKTVNGVLFPAYDRVLRLSVGPRQAEIQASAYSYQTNALVEQTMTRTRIRYGDPFTVCTNAGWWGVVTDQYIPATFEHDGETFDTLDVQWDGPTHGWVRVQQYWVDTYEDDYWSAVTIDHSVPGTVVAETFLQANDMYLDAVGLTFTQLAASGGITLAICETDRGQPDLSKVISITTVDRSALVVNAETQIPVQPVFLQGGTRYAMVIITAANHWLAVTQGENFPQGTLFYILDGAYQQGDGTRDLCFSLYAAKFRSSRVTLDLNPQQLSGGIGAIDILADTITPASTDLSYEVQIGGQWYPLGGDQGVLRTGGSLSALLPFRAVFNGTPDVMPSVKLTGSTCKISRAKTALVHISSARTLAAGTSAIHVITRLESYDAGHHTYTTKLLTGGSFATSVNPSSTVVEAQPDGSTHITHVYNLGSPVSAYKIRSEATTDSTSRAFHVAWLKDWVA
jgi:hypothetical protein